MRDSSIHISYHLKEQIYQNMSLQAYTANAYKSLLGYSTLPIRSLNYQITNITIYIYIDNIFMEHCHSGQLEFDTLFTARHMRDNQEVS